MYTLTLPVFHCERCWIRTRDHCISSLERYQWATTYLTFNIFNFFFYMACYGQVPVSVIDLIRPGWVVPVLECSPPLLEPDCQLLGDSLLLDLTIPGCVVPVLECSPPLLEPDCQLLGDTLLLDLLVQLLDLYVHQVLRSQKNPCSFIFLNVP